MTSQPFRYFVFYSITFLLSIWISPSRARAQWHSDSTTNTPVCDTVGQQDMPKGCTDGAEGAILVWEDGRNGTFQIYAQHLDLMGRATWTHNGVKLATVRRGVFSQASPIITTDDSGGAYVVWQDGRFSAQFGTCLFAQHILAKGTLAYPDSALPVAIGLNGCGNPTLCNDGRGGAYVAWEDNRSSFPSTRPDIWMNRLWRGGVKYGLSTTGTKGTVTTIDLGSHGHHNYVTYFHDSSAHFKPHMINLYLDIVGKGAYQIAGVPDTLRGITGTPTDTILTLKSYPSTGTYAYSVENLTGLAVDTVQNKQTGPSITSDGTGGCYLAWTSNTTSPNGIFATRIDSTGTALWDPAPNPGFLIYKDPNTSNPSRNVWISRDSNELLLAWEVYNSNNKSQEVFAQRMRCSSLTDTAFEWGSAIDVSSDQINDQTSPRIFSDDSTVLGARGALVPFLDAEPGSPDYVDVAMVRVEGDGGTLMPPAGNGFWFLEQKPHAHNGFKAVKITDASDGGTHTGFLAVWNDAWDGGDTMVYAQRIDRIGRKYFPTMGTSNRWGLAISGNSPNAKWTSKQVCLVPRSDGGIAAWADNRSGNFNIYAQLILKDGLHSIPIAGAPISKVLSRTGSSDGSQCNARCTRMISFDTGAVRNGIASVIAGTLNNMQLQVQNFARGADSVSFSVCVIDSLRDGSGTVSVIDTSLGAATVNFSYCTIADTLPPLVTWDSSSGWLHFHFTDNRPWDRGLDSILVTDTANVSFSSPNGPLVPGVDSFNLIVRRPDLTSPSHFSIQASDIAGKASPIYHFSVSLSGVLELSKPAISISVFPNPVSGATTVRLDGARSADVTILDVLGRMVDQFHVEGSSEWQASSLPAGTYLIRAKAGDLVVYKRIIRE